MCVYVRKTCARVCVHECECTSNGHLFLPLLHPPPYSVRKAARGSPFLDKIVCVCVCVCTSVFFETLFTFVLSKCTRTYIIYSHMNVCLRAGCMTVVSGQPSKVVVADCFDMFSGPVPPPTSPSCEYTVVRVFTTTIKASLLVLIL